MLGASLIRIRLATRRVLLRLGDQFSFQRFAKTPDWEQGTQTSTPTGAPILAAMARDTETVTRAGAGDDGDRKVRQRREVFHVEIPAFASVGGLSDEYRVTVAGTERRLNSAVMGDDETYWVVQLGTAG